MLNCSSHSPTHVNYTEDYANNFLDHQLFPKLQAKIQSHIIYPGTTELKQTLKNDQNR